MTLARTLDPLFGPTSRVASERGTGPGPAGSGDPRTGKRRTRRALSAGMAARALAALSLVFVSACRADEARLCPGESDRGKAYVTTSVGFDETRDLVFARRITEVLHTSTELEKAFASAIRGAVERSLRTAEEGHDGRVILTVNALSRGATRFASPTHPASLSAGLGLCVPVAVQNEALFPRSEGTLNNCEWRFLELDVACLSSERVDVLANLMVGPTREVETVSGFPSLVHRRQRNYEVAFQDTVQLTLSKE